MNKLIKIGENYLMLLDHQPTMAEVTQLQDMWKETFRGVGLAVMPSTELVDIPKISLKLKEMLDAQEEE